MSTLHGLEFQKSVLALGPLPEWHFHRSKNSLLIIPFIESDPSLDNATWRAVVRFSVLLPEADDRKRATFGDGIKSQNDGRSSQALMP